MRRSIPIAVAFVTLLVVPAAQAFYECRYTVVSDYSVIAGGIEWRHVEYGWVCYETGGGGTGGGGTAAEAAVAPSYLPRFAWSPHPTKIRIR